MDSTLFIVSSPFQCLCMFEAIAHFNITQYDVLVLDIANGSTTTQTKSLLFENKIPFLTYNVHHAIFDLLPFVLKKHKHYKNIFIGNYYNPTDEGIAAFYGSINYNLYFLDDGVQALSLFSNKPRNRYGKKKWEYWFKLYDALGWIKGRRKPYFFTIFDVESEKFSIVKNEFRLLRRNIYTQQAGCYIIGTNSSAVSFKDYTYDILLEQLLKRINVLYPNEKVYYCPHRRDSNNDDIAKWCSNHSIEWFSTRVSVEYDFVTKEINPRCVVGFTSNALYTLKMIYPNNDVYTVDYQCVPQSYNEEISIIRQRMNEKGIDTLTLD